MEKKNNLASKMKRLEEIVEKLNENPEIEEAVKLYEEGVKLSVSIKTYLEDAQTKIRADQLRYVRADRPTDKTKTQAPKNLFNAHIFNLFFCYITNFA